MIRLRTELRAAYNWYEREGGREFFKEYTNIADYVEKYYKTNGTKEVSGAYMIKFNDIPIAIGESAQLGVRFIEHMQRLKENGELFWGLDPLMVEKGYVDLTINILEDNILEKDVRLKKEEEKIIEFQPILQIKYDKYYPNDKILIKNGIRVSRDKIRTDQYINRKFRKERVSEALKLKRVGKQYC